MKPLTSWLMSLFMICVVCCAPNDDNTEPTGETTTEGARVTAVSVSGDTGSYRFDVTIASDETGCDQYADWWEVIDLQGNLIYRRILAHSHVNEQPFTRSGSPVTITADTEVYIRAHMNNTSYGSKAFKGSVADGFEAMELDVDFAKELENQEPLPNGCAF